MKRALAIAVLLLTEAASFAFQPRLWHYGDVHVIASWPPSIEPKEVRAAAMWLRGWNRPSLLTDLDKGLERARKDSTLQRPGAANVLVVRIADCIIADSFRVLEAAGRFTPWDLSCIQSSGYWQWDKPLVILMEDSISCPIFFGLRERRWTEVLVGDDTLQYYDRTQDLIRRYKRERTDRMEEMFRK